MVCIAFGFSVDLYSQAAYQCAQKIQAKFATADNALLAVRPKVIVAPIKGLNWTISQQAAQVWLHKNRRILSRDYEILPLDQTGKLFMHLNLDQEEITDPKEIPHHLLEKVGMATGADKVIFLRLNQKKHCI